MGRVKGTVWASQVPSGQSRKAFSLSLSSLSIQDRSGGRSEQRNFVIPFSSNFSGRDEKKFSAAPPLPQGLYYNLTSILNAVSCILLTFLSQLADVEDKMFSPLL